MPAPRTQRLKSESFAANVNKRGNVAPGVAAKRQEKSGIRPFVIGLFIFVVIGSAVFQSSKLCLDKTCRMKPVCSSAWQEVARATGARACGGGFFAASGADCTAAAAAGRARPRGGEDGCITSKTLPKCSPQ
eukprot:CAMPEP_0206808714 /NCGR_PEP_ID=MMETSP0975-20121206/5881_1 /ASSEMBLY_ACC=CAM_ASM_000399 /TAXON_ID=483370 /ORGANISM="non described non described, Strain CCMP2097" /LENGTH=131 /DNA_ID=CAMNT_0054350807 /DNA_START=39 /DNA_END=433 /DNA_ORIENTATION=+